MQQIDIRQASGAAGVPAFLVGTGWGQDRSSASSTRGLHHGTDVFERLLDSSLNEIAADDSYDNFRMQARLDAGIYYVEVGAREPGTYRVLAWSEPRGACSCNEASHE